MVFDLQEWAAAELKKLAIATNGEPTEGAPIVYIEQPTSESAEGFKECDSYDVTILFDIASRSSSKIEAYTTAKSIIEGIDLAAAVFAVNSYNFFTTDGTEEVDDKGYLQRLPIRLEMNINY